MEIFPEEKEIIGKWVLEGKRVVADTAAQRVDYLVKNYLTRISTHVDWETLYKDPRDGRYWECIYLQSEFHGGGPPSLLNISAKKAKEKYGI